MWGAISVENEDLSSIGAERLLRPIFRTRDGRAKGRSPSRQAAQVEDGCLLIFTTRRRNTLGVRGDHGRVSSTHPP
jgi:hypothetical protein